MIVSLAYPASAAEEGKTDSSTVASEVIGAIANVDPELFDNVAVAAPDRVGGVALGAKSANVRMTLPADPVDELSFSPAGKKAFTVRLPFAEQASDATAAVDGAVVYDNRNSSSTAPVMRDDGTIQINTVIESSAAPTRYAYLFGFPAGVEIVPAGTALLFLDGETLIGGLAPAWAKDSSGRDVPTSYEVDGTTVTQVVDHGPSYNYPVVADPWIGINLFSSITVDSYMSQPRVNLDLSGWGWSVYSGAAQGGGLAGIAAGQAILNTAGWDEAWGRGGWIRDGLNKPSQRQQFSCHALGAIAAGTWNLEKFRPNRTNGDWFTGVAVHHCNWTTANLY